MTTTETGIVIEIILLIGPIETTTITTPLDTVSTMALRGTTTSATGIGNVIATLYMTETLMIVSATQDGIEPTPFRCPVIDETVIGTCMIAKEIMTVTIVGTETETATGTATESLTET